MIAMAEKCPVTCGLCPAPAPAPSLAPSLAPAPIKLSSAFKLAIGPVNGEMSANQTQYFQEKAKAWVEPLLEDNEPKIDLINLEVVGQSFGSSRRRLQDNSSRLTIDIEVNGEVQASENITQASDVNFDNKVQQIFTNDATNANLITNLQNGSGTNADFFDEVTTLALPSTGNPIQKATDDNNDGAGPGNNNIGVIAASVACAAFVLFAAALYAYTKKRRR